MNKRGFTLIELVGVIVILAILGIVTFPIISGIIGKNAEALDKNQEKMIISAAKSYAMKNAFKVNSDNYCVSVSTLMEQGYLDKFDSIKGNSNDVDYKEYKVTISKDENTYKYEVIEKKVGDSCY